MAETGVVAASARPQRNVVRQRQYAAAPEYPKAARRLRLREGWQVER